MRGTVSSLIPLVAFIINVQAFAAIGGQPNACIPSNVASMLAAFGAQLLARGEESYGYRKMLALILLVDIPDEDIAALRAFVSTHPQPQGDQTLDLALGLARSVLPHFPSTQPTSPVSVSPASAHPIPRPWYRSMLVGRGSNFY